MTNAQPSFMRGYQRLDFRELRRRARTHAEVLRCAADAGRAVAEVLHWDELRSQTHTMWNCARLYHTVDSTSESARAELQFWNTHTGDIAEIDATFGAALLACPQKRALEETFGRQISRLAQCDGATATRNATSLFDEEAHLVGRYHELTSETVADIRGAAFNVLKVRKLLDSPDPSLRHQAWTIRERFCRDHGDELDHIFDRLVAVRTQIARAASLTSYVQFGHLLRRRIGYSAQDVERFLTNVEDHLVPLAHAQMVRKRERRDDGELRLWDEEAPPSGAASTIALAPSEALSALSRLLSEVHPEFVQFMETMTSEKLFDINSRPGKAGLCQCWVLPDARLPFVVAQMDGTPRDVWSLLHECGHAFHAYRARHVPLMDYIWPTSDGAELGAGGLTYLCMGNTSQFFGEHAQIEEKKEHERLLLSILRGAHMERFQHAVYSRPSISSRERREMWAALERVYFPWRQYPAAFPALREGAGFALIPHLFAWPFSGLDFALASVSVQFHRRAKHDRRQAAADYVALCDLGGTRSFVELLETGNLDSPFEAGTIRDMAAYLASVLEA